VSIFFRRAFMPPMGPLRVWGPLLTGTGITPKFLRMLADEYRREGRPPPVIPSPPVVLTPANKAPKFFSPSERERDKHRLNRVRIINEALKTSEAQVFQAVETVAANRARAAATRQEEAAERRKQAAARRGGLALKELALAKAAAAKKKGGKAAKPAVKEKAKAKEKKKGK